MEISSCLRQAASILAFAVLLAGCGDSGTTGTGALTLRITDASVDTAEHVYIQFRGLEIQSASGMRTTLYYCQDPTVPAKTVVSTAPCSTPAAPKQIDLLALTGGLADVLLNGYMLPAGQYSWIRLMVDTAGVLDSYIVLAGGAEHELTIPSGSQTGLKLNRGIVIPAGGSADFTIDFDLRKSVHVSGTGEYLLRPTLRLVDNALVGAIAGTVRPALVPAGCSPAVYVFTGDGITPDDIDGIAPDPVTSAIVKLDSGSGEYRYQAAFLEAGNYTVSYTCQAVADDPVIDNALTFTGTATVPVTANTTTVHNF
jgi:hypothetical protein